ncbi:MULTISPECIES: hypothetical protein [Thiorhodovibrio]|uniref:hypothetical protein n=1 Tax=Thiorhodovibrio TaxID=61593 RepID=UPI001A928E3F|nr:MULTISPECIES: hypothetical protein [Thiorhodovibrio]
MASQQPGVELLLLDRKQNDPGIIIFAPRRFQRHNLVAASYDELSGFLPTHLDSALKSLFNFMLLNPHNSGGKNDNPDRLIEVTCWQQ